MWIPKLRTTASPTTELEAKFPELTERKKEVDALRRAGNSKIKPNYVMATWDVSKSPRPTYVLQRGNYLSPA
jgi:hypothetical protein